MLEKIFLSNFRNFQNTSFTFSPQTTVIVGPNASGKTTILEAISLTSTGTSFRAESLSDMIQHNEELSRVQVKTNETTLEVVLTRGFVLGRKVQPKRLLVDKIGRHLSKFIGNLPTVLFWPEDLELIIGSPSKRRQFLDRVLIQISPEYRRATIHYEKALRIRNKLLKNIKDGFDRDEDQISYWSSILIENGSVMTRARKLFIEFINTFALPQNDTISFSILYDHSFVSAERFERYYDEERASGITLVGPHRDDFIVRKHIDGDEADLHRYGSRGEQRLGVLWLKLSELSYIEKSIQQKPLLLLDDIFSELDEEHRQLVSSILTKQQTIMTTTDDRYVKKHTSIIDTIRL